MALSSEHTEDLGIAPDTTNGKNRKADTSRADVLSVTPQADQAATAGVQLAAVLLGKGSQQSCLVHEGAPCFSRRY
jgi:hypothetical protein